MLTGDTVLGRGTTVVAHPDGQLGAYLDSLRRLRDLAARGGVDGCCRATARCSTTPPARWTGYLAHRHERLEQVREAVAAGAATPREVVERVYAEVDPAVWPAAELSVAAQLAYLRDAP